MLIDHVSENTLLGDIETSDIRILSTNRPRVQATKERRGALPVRLIDLCGVSSLPLLLLLRMALRLEIVTMLSF